MANIKDCPGFETFGTDVKAARSAKHLSRKTLAEIINIDSRYLANIENDGTIPSLPVIIQLMVNRKRPIILRCPVTAEERSLIEQKMAQLQTKRIGAYLRKMAIDGYIIYVDTKDIKEMNKLLSAIGRNINQIAKRVNAGGPTYQADMEEIRERLDQIWQLQRRILLSQR